MSVFREIVEVMEAALTQLGYRAGIVENQFVSDARNVIFASNLLPSQYVGLIPPSAVLYNFEPVYAQHAEFFLRELVPRFQVWDYSRFNVDRLAQLGFRDSVHYVPLGYMPALTRIDSAAEQDIDVFFSGAMSPRRERALAALHARGLKVVTVSEVYGEERDRLIARAKVVLNVHYHDNTCLFELPRVFYLLANGKAVVSEHDESLDIEPDVLAAIVPAPYERLADACWDLVHDGARRAALGAAGLRCMRARNEADILRAALAATPIATESPR